MPPTRVPLRTAGLANRVHPVTSFHPSSLAGRTSASARSPDMLPYAPSPHSSHTEPPAAGTSGCIVNSRRCAAGGSGWSPNLLSGPRRSEPDTSTQRAPVDGDRAHLMREYEREIWRDARKKARDECRDRSMNREKDETSERD